MFFSAIKHTFSSSSKAILALFLNVEMLNPAASLAYFAKHSTGLESKIVPSSKFIKYWSFPDFAIISASLSDKTFPLNNVMTSSL